MYYAVVIEFNNLQFKLMHGISHKLIIHAHIERNHTYVEDNYLVHFCYRDLFILRVYN